MHSGRGRRLCAGRLCARRLGAVRGGARIGGADVQPQANPGAGLGAICAADLGAISVGEVAEGQHRAERQPLRIEPRVPLRLEAREPGRA